MRYLTKSRFKIGLNCPTKLYYASNPDVYANSQLDDPFLKSLARGGFQVGALATCYYESGHLVKTLDKTQALTETNELLKHEDVVIFEAAIMHKNLFIRVDILEKKGNVINLIEVKSKSVDSAKFWDSIWTKESRKNNSYEMKNSEWKPYIYDVAFQAHVLKLAFPEYQVHSHLLLADKRKQATVDGLNQKFFLKPDNEVVLMGDVSPAALGAEILTKIDISEIIYIIHTDQELSERFDGKGWASGIEYMAEQYVANVRIPAAVGPNCKHCEFRCEDDGLKSGFKECWTLAHGFTNEELDKPLIFDIWNYRGTAKALEADKILMEDLDESDFKAGNEGVGLSQSQRQWLQVEKIKNADTSSYIDLKGIELEFAKFKAPYHMIDFETCMVAIPFNKGRRPYEQMAFQFSHHMILDDGAAMHSDEFICCTPGEFPNFNFVRALKKALSNDNGTIFRYSFHENTVLKQIKEQLLASQEADQKELIEFIDSITDDAPRTMVDLCNLVKKYYYSPYTEGSNSIKYVLPAILKESKFLQKKYSQPTYNSKSFINHQWITIDSDGTVSDPYKTLPPIFNEQDYAKIEKMVMAEGQDEIANGGAALTAYAMMQFTEMSEAEREKVRDGLLRYCHLDTLAMVMIWEFMNDLLSKKE